MILATSIYPRELERQKSALKSWQELGFEVVSINAPDEMQKIKGYFPSVKFIKAERDARKEVGKPCIYFDDFVSFLRQSGEEISGIVNSDIFLHADSNFTDFIKKEALGSVLFGSRLDVDDLECIQGRFYHEGFDYFFFDKAVLSAYPQSDFCVGMPWWDYWAPLVPMMKGIPAKRLITPVVRHLRHKQNFTLYPWIRFGQSFGEYLGLSGMSKEAFCSISDAFLAKKEYAGFQGITQIAYFSQNLINGFSERAIYTPSKKGTLFSHAKTLIGLRRLECVKKMLMNYRERNGKEIDIESSLSSVEALLLKAKRMNRLFEEFNVKNRLADAENILWGELRLAEDIHDLYNNCGLIKWKTGATDNALNLFSCANMVDLDPKASLLNYSSLLERMNWKYGKKEILQKLYGWRYPDVEICEGFFAPDSPNKAIESDETSVSDRPGLCGKAEHPSGAYRGRMNLDGFLRNVSGLVHIGAGSDRERDQYAKYGLRVIWIEPIPEITETLKKNILNLPLQPHHYDALIVNAQGSELLILEGAASILPNFRYIKTEAPDFEANEGCCQLSDITSFLARYRFRERSRREFAGRVEGGSYYEVVYERMAYRPGSVFEPCKAGQHRLSPGGRKSIPSFSELVRDMPAHDLEEAARKAERKDRVERIVVAEYPKSGGSWLVNLLADALALPKRDIYVKTGFSLFDVLKHPWYEDSQSLELTESCVIKSHEFPDSKLLDFPAKTVHLVRDGRDAIVSKYFFEKDFCVQNGFIKDFNITFDDYVEKTSAEWSNYVEAWMARDVITCRYEDLLRNPMHPLKNILESFGVCVSTERIHESIMANTKEKMRKALDKTFKYNTFVRKGIVGDWKEHFSDYNKDAFKKQAGDVLIRLGYEDSNDW